MAKKKKAKKASRPTAGQPAPQTGSTQAFLERHPHFLPLAVLAVLLLIFFNEVMFGGKAFLPADTIAAKSVQPFIHDALSRGIYPKWNPYIFSGMPSFASLQSAPFVDLLGDVIHGAYWLLSKVLPLSEFTRILVNYFLLGLFTYLLLLKKTGLRLVALFAALALVFQPQIISFTAFGHNTKIATAVFIPLLFLLLDEFLEKRQLRYFALLALSVGLQLLRAHTQLAYYTFMMMGLYLLFWLVESAMKKRPVAEVVKSVALVGVALFVGVVMSSWLYLSVLEYAEYSIRGGGTGLDYGYATNWSFHPLEMVTFFVPSFMGFGGETYWGKMPFTHYPLYPGVLTIMLAGAALVVNRNRYVVFLWILAGLSLLVSFGKHFPILYDPLFKFLPYFNKFRVPSMIHILLAFALSALAGFGLHGLFTLRDAALRQKARTYFYVFAGVCALLGLRLLLAKGWYLGLVMESGRPLSQAAATLAQKMAATDGLKLLMLVGAAVVLLVYFLQQKLKATTLGLSLVALLMLDLWFVDFKLVDPQPKQSEKQYFAETDAVRFLKQQEGPFRIYPVFDDKPESWYMYHFIQNVKGYHAAKLKIYQTFLEKTRLDARGNLYGMAPFLAKYVEVGYRDGQPVVRRRSPEEIGAARLRADEAVLDMLNVKYLVSYYPVPDPRYRPVAQGRPGVYENTGVLPRAFFVDEIKVVEEPEAFFDLLLSGRFDPSKTAVLEEPPDFSIEPSAENRAEVVSFDIHEIEIEAEVAKPALLVLSEIYYPAGWKAYVDGKETRIYKTNYILRSIFLEPGTHRIRFEFAPKMFTIGLAITFGVLAVLLALLVYDLKFRSRRGREAVARSRAEAPAPAGN